MLPNNSVVTVIGAGGKTTCVHHLASFYAEKGRKCIITTSTKMALEEGLCQTLQEVTDKFKDENVAFVGKPIIHKGKNKIVGFEGDEFEALIKMADMVFVEGDGAAGRYFKAPKDTEPVIPKETTHIVLATGMLAVGKTIKEGAYNIPGILAAFRDESEKISEETILTPHLMTKIYEKTYLKRLKAEQSNLPVTIMASQADTPELFAEAKKFLNEFKNQYEVICQNKMGFFEDTMKYHCIYMASGFGKRFGSNKLLAEYKGIPLYRSVLNRLLELQKCYPMDVTVVTQYQEIMDDLSSESINLVENKDAAEGQSASIRKGVEYIIQSLQTDPDDYLIFFVGDQPCLKKDTIARFLNYLKEKKPLICAVKAGEKRGNPVAFSISLAGELMELKGDTGGRMIIKAHIDECDYFTEIDPEELKDIDCPEDMSG